MFFCPRQPKAHWTLCASWVIIPQTILVTHSSDLFDTSVKSPSVCMKTFVAHEKAHISAFVDQVFEVRVEFRTTRVSTHHMIKCQMSKLCLLGVAVVSVSGEGPTFTGRRMRERLIHKEVGLIPEKFIRNCR